MGYRLHYKGGDHPFTPENPSYEAITLVAKQEARRRGRSVEIVTYPARITVAIVQPDGSVSHPSAGHRG